MQRRIIPTADGSPTVEIPDLGITYHSRHGAVQESMHVFIEAGLRPLLSRATGETLRVFEMGFGTGLNALLSAEAIKDLPVNLHYTTVEQFPLQEAEVKELHFEGLDDSLLQDMHTANWNEPVALRSNFTLLKLDTDLLSLELPGRFHLIYYDAFAPAAQPELWTVTVFQKLFNALLPGGILVTYCSKGDVRRALIAAGFEVEKLPGPKGKREMLRANVIS